MIGLLFSIYSVGLLIASPLFGALSDQIGRRTPMIFGLLGLAASSLLFAFATSFWMLLAARICQGISAGWVKRGQKTRDCFFPFSFSSSPFCILSLFSHCCSSAGASFVVGNALIADIYRSACLLWLLNAGKQDSGEKAAIREAADYTVADIFTSIHSIYFLLRCFSCLFPSLLFCFLVLYFVLLLVLMKLDLQVVYRLQRIVWAFY